MASITWSPLFPREDTYKNSFNTVFFVFTLINGYKTSVSFIVWGMSGETSERKQHSMLGNNMSSLLFSYS
jgi:hypothetical protein